MFQSSLTNISKFKSFVVNSTALRACSSIPKLPDLGSVACSTSDMNIMKNVMSLRCLSGRRFSSPSSARSSLRNTKDFFTRDRKICSGSIQPTIRTRELRYASNSSSYHYRFSFAYQMHMHSAFVFNNLTSTLNARSPRRESPSGREYSTAALVSGPKEKQLVVYERGGSSGESQLGLLIRPDGKRNWILNTKYGQAVSIAPNAISYILPGANYVLADIAAIEEQAQQFRSKDENAESEDMEDNSLLEMAWEILQGGVSSSSVTVAELSEMLFSSEEAPACYATYAMLSSDRVYFKARARAYEPRPASQVEMLKKQLESERAKQKAIQELKGVFHAAIDSTARGEPFTVSGWGGVDSQAWLHLCGLEALAVNKGVGYGEFDTREEKDQAYARAEFTLKLLGKMLSVEGAREVLVAVGHWRPHESIRLRASGLADPFPPHILRAAEELASVAEDAEDPDAAIRQDLTHLKVFMIDDAGTKEVDDGISFEQLEDGRVRIWAHVADPSSYLPGTPAPDPDDEVEVIPAAAVGEEDSAPGSESPGAQWGAMLDLQARKRCTSAYLPTGSVSMFPLALAAGPFSLRQGQMNRSMSFGVEVCPDTGAPLGSPLVVASTVKADYSLTYDQADELLALGHDYEPELCMLLKTTEKYKQWRKESGALDFNFPESNMYVKNLDSKTPEVDFQPINGDSPSRSMVAECMIAAGAAAGSLGQQEGMILPFRAQPTPPLPDPEVLQAIPDGLPRLMRIRSCMPPSTTSTTASPHASLGLPAYVQVTSPIRRYTDLLAHYQLKAFLHGRPAPFQDSQFKLLSQKCSAGAREVSQIQREAERYWTTHYFAHQPRDEEWDGIFLKWINEDTRMGIVLLSSIAREMLVKMNSNAPLGAYVRVRCLSADISSSNVRLVEIRGDPTLNNDILSKL